MKKPILFLSLIVIVSVIFTSCSSSLTKRHYRKGYYVEHKHKPTTPIAKISEKTLNKPEEKPESVVVAPEQSVIAIQPKAQDVPEFTTPKLKRDKFYRLQEKEQTAELNFIPKKIKENRFSAMASKMGPSGATSDDVLSLFWIVLLVILIIYLLGFLFGGYGLGAFVHLLLVVFLILLILWLLRLI